MARFFKPQKRKLTDTKHKEMTIRRLDHLGAGIGHLDKKPVFVDGALPDETVVVQLTEDKKQYARAKVIKRLNDSPARTQPLCPIYEQCGGCNLQHLSHAGQVAAKQQALGELMGKFAATDQGQSFEQAPPISGDAWHYRRRARFSLRAESGPLQFGFRRKQSKAIVDVSHCPVLADSLNALLPPLRELLAGLKGKKHLGHVELVEADNGRVVMIRHLQPFNDVDQAALQTFAKQHSVILYLAPTADSLERVAGEAPYYAVDGQKLYFTPRDFIQVNRSVNAQMVQQALDWLEVGPQDRVLDLFCGLGNFSLPLAKQVQAVVGVEGVDEMVRRATENATQAQLTNTEFYQANLEEDVTTQPWAQAPFTKILLDPARAGAAGVMSHVVKLAPERVVYVSCNPATLARDSQVLLQQGYQLARLGMLDMFPHTGHLESMALFIRSDQGRKK
ncbi:23S rRNA (uracil(1939)-C(5))-methyltransferase RlmD [Photobacterium sp. MCCC 1A19761]|uniref:23S rRNA (uracil(1939)-C(5))-methyltransferase RlmD n=1 Tax=Photobacterium sp. MCCC 1A19761 TaxID=3115000 RepID=UPI00307F6CEE